MRKPPMADWGPDAPMAVKGLVSYRYAGLFGWVMIGAKDHDDALLQAERSLSGEKAVLSKLQVWSGTEYVGLDTKFNPAAWAALVRCEYCEAGFRRVGGIHIGSQKLGMIPNTPCERVFASHVGQATALNTKAWLAYVDGKPFSNARGVPRRYSTAETAYRAACAAAPKNWHD